MNKQTIAFIVLMVILTAVVLFYAVPKFFSGGAKPSVLPQMAPQPATTTTTAQGPTAPSRDVALEDQSWIERTIRFDSTSFRNPMSPLVKEGGNTEKTLYPRVEQKKTEDVVTLTGYTVHGIIWSPQSPLALVNDQVVGVGEELDAGGKIQEITVNSITLEKNERLYTLPIWEEEEL